MFDALKYLLDPEPMILPTRIDAEQLADAHREIEREMDFAVRAGRGGWMIARLRKNGPFHSWVIG